MKRLGNQEVGILCLDVNKNTKMTIKSKVASATKLVKKVSKKAINFINDDYTTLPLAERELMFRNELSALIVKYNVGLSVAAIDITPQLPTIE